MPSLFAAPPATLRNAPWVPIRGFIGRPQSPLDELVSEMLLSRPDYISRLAIRSPLFDLLESELTRDK